MASYSAWGHKEGDKTDITEQAIEGECFLEEQNRKLWNHTNKANLLTGFVDCI